MRYGLLGEKLGHSFSKQIHESLSNITYELIEKSRDEFDDFMKTKDFKAINVTIPYKEMVIPYLDVIDARASRIGAVNTIVNCDGKLYGYNTDYEGIIYLLNKYDITVKDKVVAILGSGGTSKTATAVVEDYQASKIYHVSRTAKDGYITYEELYERQAEIQVIINTTPVGMYPNNDGAPIDIAKFKNCESVIDVVYNPLRTKLILEAKELGMKTATGLEMLIVQGIKAHELFLSKSYTTEKYQELISNITFEKENIVFIGMPTCGKSTIARMLSEALEIPLVDIDSEIVTSEGRPITEIFANNGETYFREVERSITKALSQKNHQIIATGGGIIKDKRNIDYLKQNGIIIFIDRDIELLQNDDTRPLSSTKDQLVKLYKERYSLYTKYADYIIKNNDDIKRTLEAIKEKLYEVTSN